MNTYVVHSTIHTEKSNKMQQRIKIYYSIHVVAGHVQQPHVPNNLPRMQNQRLLVQF